MLIGAGIMSATLGVFLKELEPSLNIAMFETLEDCGQESSQAWNNAGTGHAANCEMNYTPERPDGSIDISKALEVNVEFDLSRQFWSHLIRKGAIEDPRGFIHPVPHMSFVWGDANVAFLHKRFAAMSAHPCYHGMEYTEDGAEDRRVGAAGDGGPQERGENRGDPDRHRHRRGLRRARHRSLWCSAWSAMPGFAVNYRHRVTGIDSRSNERWRWRVDQDLEERQRRHRESRQIRLHRRGRRR